MNRTKKFRTWILVADGARARILLSEGWNKGLRLVASETSATATEPTRALGTDKPGRVHDRVDVGRHAMEPRADWHRMEKQQFAAHLADILNKAVREDAFDRLVLVVPPKALGDLRAKLDPQTRARVVAELNKDLTQVADHDLPDYLQNVVPV